SGSLIGFLTALGQVRGQLSVVVPVAMEELDEAYSAFGQPPRQQAIRREAARLLRILAIELEGTLWFFGNIGQLGNGCLHAEGHLILSDSCGDLRIAEFVQTDLIQLVQFIQEDSPVIAEKAWRIGKIEDRVAYRTELDALIPGRKKAAAPQTIVERLGGRPPPPPDHPHKAGENAAFAAPSQNQPRPPSRPPRRRRARLREQPLPL